METTPTTQVTVSDARDRRFHDILICLVLAGVVFVLYWRTTGYLFVDYDDNKYVYANPHLRLGFTPAGIRWAITTGYFSYWHPVTWITYLAATSAFGFVAGPLHAVNFSIHALVACLLFATLKYMTGDRWRSAVVAALWAWHPLRVESVAWISETKDVLGGMFWLLTCLAYAWYARRPGVGRYLLVAVFCVLGLASKPTVVMLPFVLLLLDVWPLGRFNLERLRDNGQLRRAVMLVAEKIPLIGLAVIVAGFALSVQRANGAVVEGVVVPLPARLANAVNSIVVYLSKTFWPINLAMFYPHPTLVNSPVPVTRLLLCIAILVGVSLMVWKRRVLSPYLLFGWVWFLFCLAPTIGLVQAGDQAMADRYTYLPAMGFTAGLVWCIADLCRTIRRPIISSAAGVVIALACCAVTWQQIPYWQNSVTLFTRANDATEKNYLALNVLSDLALQFGWLDDALALADASLSARPTTAGYSAKGYALAAQGRLEAARAALQIAASGDPRDGNARAALGDVLHRLGRDAEADAWMREALTRDVKSVAGHEILADWLDRQGRRAEADLQRQEASDAKSFLAAPEKKSDRN